MADVSLYLLDPQARNRVTPLGFIVLGHPSEGVVPHRWLKLHVTNRILRLLRRASTSVVAFFPASAIVQNWGQESLRRIPKMMVAAMQMVDMNL